MASLAGKRNFARALASIAIAPVLDHHHKPYHDRNKRGKAKSRKANADSRLGTFWFWPGGWLGLGLVRGPVANQQQGEHQENCRYYYNIEGIDGQLPQSRKRPAAFYVLRN